MTRRHHTARSRGAIGAVLTLVAFLAVIVPATAQQPQAQALLVFTLSTLDNVSLVSVREAMEDLRADDVAEAFRAAYFADPRAVLNGPPYDAGLSDSEFGVAALDLILEPAPDESPWLGISPALPDSVARPFALTYLGDEIGLVIRPVRAPGAPEEDQEEDMISGFLETISSISTGILDDVRSVLVALEDGSENEMNALMAGPRKYFSNQEVYFPSDEFEIYAIDVPRAIESGALGISPVLPGVGTYRMGIGYVDESAVTFISLGF